MQPFGERSDEAGEKPEPNFRVAVEPNGHPKVRMTVQEASAALGITVEAVRGRMHRGKFGREKAEDGRVFVILSPNQLANVRQADNDRLSNGRSSEPDPGDKRSDERSTNGHDQSSEPEPQDLHEREDLVEELRDHVAFLRAELEARSEESRRKDSILMALTQRVPELEAPRDIPPQTPPESRDASETFSKHDPRADASNGSQEPARQRAWFKRFFFGP
jgi:hypothetical protein